MRETGGLELASAITLVLQANRLTKITRWVLTDFSSKRPLIFQKPMLKPRLFFLKSIADSFYDNKQKYSRYYGKYIPNNI